ncbi:MAG TPA: demethoxyubiquinone hydroxylase family protein, partial [Pseudomonadales bacterium]|nr:demethoxyubiquinone hydroxylase family protein [Pseudomonadales bacterium]
MNSYRRLSRFDRLLGELQHCVETLSRTSTSARPTPGAQLPEADLSERERRHAAGLMRVNHAGGVPPF